MSVRIVLALDGLSEMLCLDLAKKLGPCVWAVKIHDAYDRYGRRIIDGLRKAGVHRIWVDAKLHDTPNTARLRAEALAIAGADILSVHASGGVEMMTEAARGFRSDAVLGHGRREVYAITVLTTLGEDDAYLLHGKSAGAEVLRLAQLANLADMDGVVCSPREVGKLVARPELMGGQFIVPGVRSAGSEWHDERRIDTPFEAVKSGATHIVVGRQITQDSDPVRRFEIVEAECKAAEAEIEARVG